MFISVSRTSLVLFIYIGRQSASRVYIQYQSIMIRLKRRIDIYGLHRLPRNCTEYEGIYTNSTSLIQYIYRMPSCRRLPRVAAGCPRERKRTGRPSRKRIAGRKENGSAESRRDRSRGVVGTRHVIVRGAGVGIGVRRRSYSSCMWIAAGVSDLGLRRRSFFAPHYI